ncbi:CGNR zinc finger domain-containing protein [Leifsonia shinshuensis]|uniref:CGNR zinc finger domain-containing protein n=1 Tax=Leifsonia shinshuensis TaxID=150026 RepID=UPI00285FF306|nr:CGNR zinc finger domain-containing protein [Leifsonia shinshuensis]MDR6972894.1 hypothetical protein [Leifsonia shinshuensis]
MTTTPTAAWASSSRYGVEDGPGGLAFVEALLNTTSGSRPGQPDLLTDQPSAQSWLRDGLEQLRHVDSLAPTFDIVIDEDGVETLRHLRSELRLAIVASSDPGMVEHPIMSASTSISLESGEVRLHATGGGLDLLRSYLLVQLVKASYRDTLRRLKICAAPDCDIAFFDRSKNCSKLWHDVATCGNAYNARAYRDRKRAQQRERGTAA